jgi:hypothetical protein
MDPNLPIPDSEVENAARTGHTPENASEIASPIQSSESSPPTTQPMLPSSGEVEHAYWAEYEEDTTTPDEDEIKEIDGGDSDYSACDRRSQLFGRLVHF